jgi:hypothetical protein
MRRIIPARTLLIACTSCSFGFGYDTQFGARSATFTETATGNGVPISDMPQLGEWVVGSDGSYGWRMATSAPRATFDRVSDSVVHACKSMGRASLETRANCSGVTVIVRQDDLNVYRVCDRQTDVMKCVATWSTIP